MKKTYYILITIIIITTFIYIIYPKQDIVLEEEPIPKEYTITYTYGGGFGTYVTTLTKEVIIESDGNITIKLINEELNIKPLTYTIEKDKVDELYKYLIDNRFKSMRKDISDNRITDYYSAYITLKTNDYEKKIGGYAASTNKRFNKLENKILETIDKDNLNKFDDILEKEIEK